MLPNKNYIVHKINIKETQSLHRIKLRILFTDTPLENSYTKKNFGTDDIVINSKDDLHSIAWKQKSNPSLFDHSKLHCDILTIEKKMGDTLSLNEVLTKNFHNSMITQHVPPVTSSFWINVKTASVLRKLRGACKQMLLQKKVIRQIDVMIQKLEMIQNQLNLRT